MATIRGTDGNDNLNGTRNADDIFCEDGDDTAKGEAETIPCLAALETTYSLAAPVMTCSTRTLTAEILFALPTLHGERQ